MRPLLDSRRMLISLCLAACAVYGWLVVDSVRYGGRSVR